MIGTPGRLIDLARTDDYHTGRSILRLDKLDMIIMDEADRMLDMGFEKAINLLLKYLPKRKI